jgi:hypothetical protein
LLRGSGLGFWFDRSESNNPCPDAWCSSCEGVRLANGGWDSVSEEEYERTVDVRLVCGECYGEIKVKNQLQ